MNQTFSRAGLIVLLVALLGACGGGGATGAGGSGGAAGTPAASPTTPTNVAAKANGATGILLSWTAATGATGYNVYQATSANQSVAAMTKVNTTPIAYGALPYTDTGLTAATTYYYKVTAIIGGAENPSSEVSARTLSTAALVQMGGALQGNPLTLIGGVSTVASGLSTPTLISTDGKFIYETDQGSRDVLKIDPATGISTILIAGGVSGSPRGQTTDGTNLYIVDIAFGLIEKVVLATGVTSTYMTGFHLPNAITTDGINLYVADFNGIKKVNLATNAMSTLTTVPAFDMTTDGSSLYIINGYAINKVDMVTGAISSFAGSVTQYGQQDGVGPAATLLPRSLTTDGTTIYVVQSGTMANYPGRRIDIATATVSTVPSMTDGYGVTTDGSSLYFTTGTSLKKLF